VRGSDENFNIVARSACTWKVHPSLFVGPQRSWSLLSTLIESSAPISPAPAAPISSLAPPPQSPHQRHRHKGPVLPPQSQPPQSHHQRYILQSSVIPTTLDRKKASLQSPLPSPPRFWCSRRLKRSSHLILDRWFTWLPAPVAAGNSSTTPSLSCLS
jgi:hypothetical protein